MRQKEVLETAVTYNVRILAVTENNRYGHAERAYCRRLGNLAVTSSACRKQGDRGRHSFLHQGTGSFCSGQTEDRQGPVAKKRYQAVGFPCNRMLKLSSSRGIRTNVPVLSVSWSLEDHSVIIQALRKGLTEREASDTGGVPRWKSSCPDRLAEAIIFRYFSELCWRSLAEELGRCCRVQQIRPLHGVRRT